MFWASGVPFLSHMRVAFVALKTVKKLSDWVMGACMSVLVAHLTYLVEICHSKMLLNGTIANTFKTVLSDGNFDCMTGVARTQQIITTTTVHCCNYSHSESSSLVRSSCVLASCFRFDFPSSLCLSAFPFPTGDAEGAVSGAGFFDRFPRFR